MSARLDLSRSSDHSLAADGVIATGVLAELVTGAVEDAARRAATVPLDDVREAAAARPPALDVLGRLRERTGVHVVAEVKRASPSKGALADIPDPADLAARYAAGGAGMISVLTEGRRFGGSLEDLAAVRDRVDVPVLRKDFVVTPRQVWEARAHGADAVLLIVAALDTEHLTSLLALVQDLGMTALVEVHDAAEGQRALGAGAELIGVNNRDLRTLDVDPQRFAAIAPTLAGAAPGQRPVLVAESGITSAQDVAAAVAAGADAVLVGEALVRSEDPTSTIETFRAAGAGAGRTR